MEFRIKITYDMAGYIDDKTYKKKPSELTPSEKVELIKQLCDIDKLTMRWFKKNMSYAVGGFPEIKKPFTDYLEEEMSK
jgi:hypothetical protein